ncbi:MAG: hypothetical protein ACREDV_01775 [Methylocella sp.]
MIAASVAFIMLPATFPGFAAMVELYSLVADPQLHQLAASTCCR